MGWPDRLFNWVDGQVAQHTDLDRWLEQRLHEHGLHGPAARHLLRAQIIPDATLILAAVLVLAVFLMFRRARRRRRFAYDPALTRAVWAARRGLYEDAG